MVTRILFASASVSIHASVKDATNYKGKSSSISSFNPRICKRCDLIANMVKFGVKCFNPRICKRCDAPNFSCCCSSFGFNPRICKRCDVRKDGALVCQQCFNPRICKRCDIPSPSSYLKSKVSIHASVKDATGVAKYIK